MNGSNAPGGGEARLAASWRAPDGGGGAHREQLRVVRAGDGPVEPVGVVGGVAAAAVDEAPRLVDHPRQRPRVAGQRRPHRRVELAVDERLRARVLDEVDDRPDRDPHAPAAAVGGPHGPGQRPRAQPLEQRAEAVDGAPAGAARVARADGVEGVARHRPRRHVPRVEPAHGIGGVEQDRVQQVLVARDERLHEVGPVRVAVQVDPPEPQRPDQRGQVTGRVGGREQVGRPVAPRDLPRAAGDHRRERQPRADALVVLEPALDQRAAAGAALVHQEQPALAQQRPVDAGVLDAAAGGWEPWSALDRHQRRVIGGPPRGQPPERHPDPPALRPRRVERARELAAPPARTVGAAVQRELAHAQRGGCCEGRRRGDRAQRDRRDQRPQTATGARRRPCPDCP